MEPSDAKRLWAFEDGNGKLKKLLAEQMLDNTMLRDINSKNGDACCDAGSGGSSVRSAWCEPAAGV
jgi:putative transposase